VVVAKEINVISAEYKIDGTGHELALSILTVA
jgi:hypothetical protein